MLAVQLSRIIFAAKSYNILLLMARRKKVSAVAAAVRKKKVVAKPSIAKSLLMMENPLVSK